MLWPHVVSSQGKSGGRRDRGGHWRRRPINRNSKSLSRSPCKALNRLSEEDKGERGQMLCSSQMRWTPPWREEDSRTCFADGTGGQWELAHTTDWIFNPSGTQSKWQKGHRCGPWVELWSQVRCRLLGEQGTVGPVGVGSTSGILSIVAKNVNWWENRNSRHSKENGHSVGFLHKLKTHSTQLRVKERVFAVFHWATTVF